VVTYRATTLMQCIELCDNTSTCVAVSFVPGSPNGPCYIKNANALLQPPNYNPNIQGARQVSACTTTTATSDRPATKLARRVRRGPISKLHRKRVVPQPQEAAKMTPAIQGFDFSIVNEPTSRVITFYSLPRTTTTVYASPQTS
jgi:hypothetical protein